MPSARSTSLALFAGFTLVAGTAAAAGRTTYFKMVPTHEASAFSRGQLLQPRFSTSVLDGDGLVSLHGKTYDGGAAERLFVSTHSRLQEEGKISASAPGRHEGVYATTDLDRFPAFRDDPTRSRVQLEPVDVTRVATYDRRHFLTALRALDRAEKATTESERERALSTAARAAERYYLAPPKAGDREAEPETLIGSAARVVDVQLRGLASQPAAGPRAASSLHPALALNPFVATWMGMWGVK